MTTFGWTNPFPIRFGRSKSRRTKQAFRTIRDNTGSVLTDSDTSINVCEDMAAARVLCMAQCIIDRRVNQSDPMKLSNLLERWEDILQIVPSTDQTDWARRRAVAARLKTLYGGRAGELAALAEEAFSPWTVRLHFVPPSKAVMFWPGNGNASQWSSTVAIIIVEYIRPANASQDEVDERTEACLEALNNWAPSWATFNLSETQSYGTNAQQFGFYCDQPNIDIAVLTD